MKIIWAWIIIKENRILLIKRSKNKPVNNFPNYWSFPWWRHENNETPEETAVREVKEEIWVDFFITRILDEYKTEYNNFHHFLWDYSWTIILQEEECDWYGWFNYEETKKMLINERINWIFEKLHIEGLI